MIIIFFDSFARLGGNLIKANETYTPHHSLYCCVINCDMRRLAANTNLRTSHQTFARVKAHLRRFSKERTMLVPCAYIYDSKKLFDLILGMLVPANTVCVDRIIKLRISTCQDHYNLYCVQVHLEGRCLCFRQKHPVFVHYKGRFLRVQRRKRVYNIEDE
jgi:hypothetical protein